MTDSFARFSFWVLRHRWAVLAVWAVLLAVAGGLLQPRASSVVKGADSAVPGSGSDKASAVLARDFHASSTHTVAVIFRSRTMTVDSAAYRRQVVEASRKIAAIQGVRSVVTYFNTGNPSLVSRDRHATLASIALAGSDEQATKMVPDIRARLRGLTVEHYAIGTPALIKDTLTTSETDLHRSELFTIPIVLILLLLVFRTAVAAAIPLVLGMCSVALSLGLIAIIGSYVDTSVFALNISSMMGLGLGIDFSLIVVGRFREELSAGRGSWDAVAATMATAGRSITYSGVTVILAMVIMSVFMHDIVIIRSISMAVILVAVTALLAGLTVLPVLLGLLGHRIELLRVVPRSGRGQGGLSWYRLSHAIMRHPWMWLLPSIVVLIVASLPVRTITFELASPDLLPQTVESVHGSAVMAQAFGPGSLTPIQVVVETSRSHLWTPEVLGGIQRLTNDLASDPRTASVQSLSTVASGAGVSPARFLRLTPAFFASNRRLAGTAAQVVNLKSGADRAVIVVVSRYAEFDKRHEGLVDDLRSKIIPSIPGLRTSTVLVGGAAANFIDYRDSIYGRFPFVVGAVMLLIFIILMMFFQSILLPLKAMLLNLLSILATFGVLVLIFQNGLGHQLLGLTSYGRIYVPIPPILYVILFALSTDYEVLMLSRVREVYHRKKNNEEAVATGLARTAGAITAAGLVLIGTFGSFATADVVIMKEVGVGLAIGVLIDATIARVIMVPATMRLMGDLNWWMPAWLARIIPELREGMIPEPALVPAPVLEAVAAATAGRPALDVTQPLHLSRPVSRGRLHPIGGSIGADLVVLPELRPLRIGRDRVNEMQLFDENVSRFQARIDYDSGRYTITDLDSSNGVYVNYDRIPPQQQVALNPGDTIQISGMHKLSFRFDVAREDELTGGRA